MSVLTEVLKLFKYDPATDGDMTFNIGQCMNDNWDKLDAAILLAIAAAGAYNPEESYAVGDYCTYKGKLRKCSTAIPTGETWTEAHWTTTTVAAELAELSSQLSNAVMNIGKVPQSIFGNPGYPTSYVGSVDDRDTLMENLPGPGHWRILYIPYFAAASEGWSVQIAIGAVENAGLYWRKARGFTWAAWENAATPTPPQEFDLPLADGWVRVNAAEYWKTQEGVVIVTFCVAPENGAAIDTSTHIIATLPEGFRPNGYTPHIAVSTMNPGTDMYDASAWIDGNGNICAQTRTSIPQSGGSSPTGWAGFAGTFVFVADS